MIVIRARISRTIQEKQYHPFNVELEVTEEIGDKASYNTVASLSRGLADTLIEEVDAIMTERQAQIAKRR